MKLHVCVALFVRLIKTVANETKSALMNSLPNNERALLVAAEKILFEAATNRSLGPSEVRVKMQAATICGSDISYFMNGRSGSFELKTPFVLGHEGSGEHQIRRIPLLPQRWAEAEAFLGRCAG